MKVVSWSTRSLNDPSKRALKKFINYCSPNVVMIQESKKDTLNSMLSLTAPFGVTSLVFPLVWNGEDSSYFQSPHQTQCYV